MTRTINYKKIAIHSVPRSGSSWIGQVFNSSPSVNFKFQPLFSYAFKGYLNEKSSKEKITEFYQKIAESQDDFLLQTEKIKKGSYPFFQKNLDYTHIIYKEVRYHHILENMLQVDPDIIVIGIIRNPCAVTNSFLHAPREFRKDLAWNELTEWEQANKKNLNRKEEFNGFEKWQEVAILFHQLKLRYPNKFYLLNYNDILSNTIQEVEKVFNFCDLEVTQQTQSFISKSNKVDKSDPYAVFKIKNEDTAWKKSLSPIIAGSIIKKLEKSILKKYLNG